MKLSKRGEYALRSMINLGIAAKVGRPLVAVTALAKAEGLPLKFLEQIMQQLRAGGFVESVRGKQGGYRLAQSADRMVIGQIVRLVDGPLAPIGCVSQSAYAPCNCPDEAHCGLRMLMLDVRNAIAGILDRYTLAEVVDVTTRKMIKSGRPLPFSGIASVSKSAQSKVSRVIARGARRVPAPGFIYQLLGSHAG